MLFEMAARGIPVVHLLHVRGLATRHGLSWDPVPLPEPGVTRILDDQRTRTPGVWLIAAFYVVSLVGIAVLLRFRIH
jgi:hypothetical protein